MTAPRSHGLLSMYRPAMPPDPVYPTFKAQAFTCPHCGAFAAQSWLPTTGDVNLPWSSVCRHCESPAVWVDGAMVFPEPSLAPEPNEDMPAPVRVLYDEAASVSSRSPRASAALLRLAADRLCDELGCDSTASLHAKVGELKDRGLSQGVIDALDVVRITGNNAVHPGEITEDEMPTVTVLFGLLNQIVDYMVTQPAATRRLLAQMPTGAIAAIERRDAAK